MSSAHEAKSVRVATIRATGKRYLLDVFNGAQALLFGELVAFKGLRSEHETVRWVAERDIMWSEQHKTTKLLMSLLKQAVDAKGAAIKITNGGAKLCALDDAGNEVEKAKAAEVFWARLSVEERSRIVARFTRCE